MRKFKRRHPHSLPFRLFLVLAGASLLLTALAPRTNAGLADYWGFEDPAGPRLRPAPELFSQPQGVLVNQPLASNYNPTLALNVAPGGQPGGFQPQQVDANFSWTGAANTTWSNPGNWSPSGPPGGTDTAVFDGAFSNQPNIIAATIAVGELHMATGVAQNVTISASLANILTIEGVGIPGTGILIDNASAFTLTITARIAVDASQAWTNNSGNLFTVSGATVVSVRIISLRSTAPETRLSQPLSMMLGMGSAIIKDGSGTLTITGNNTYSGGTIVNSGTLLVNGRGDLGDGNVTVNNSGTLGGDSTSPIISRGVFGNARTRLTVAAGGNLAPGNGGNNTAVFTVNALTLQPASNFRIDINGTSPGIGYDRLVVTASGNSRFVITNSNLVVTVGTTLSVGQSISHWPKNSSGIDYAGTFAQGKHRDGQRRYRFLGQLHRRRWQRHRAHGDPGAPVPEPSTWIGGALAIAGLAFTQRRRLRKLIARRCAVP